MHSCFIYIPYLRFCGFTEETISKIKNFSSGISSYSITKNAYLPKINMQPLRVDNSLEEYFSKINIKDER